MRKSATILAIAAGLLAAPAWAETARPIVVELYTSQNCAPCVTADSLLGKLAARPDVIALTQSVNYWDILGWKDTLASDATTNRQKAYAASLGRGGVYTPQIIVDGQTDVVGSREDEVEAAVDEARKRLRFCISVGEKKPIGPCVVPMTVSRGIDNTLSISVPAAGIRKYDASIWVFAVRRSATVNVGGGENKGRTLRYTNVVRDVKPVGKWNGTAATTHVTADEIKILPKDDVVVLLQQNKGGRIWAVEYLPAVQRGH